MSGYDHMDRSNGDNQQRRDGGFEQLGSNYPRRQSDHLHSDYRNRANMPSGDSMAHDQWDRIRNDRYDRFDYDPDGRNIWSRSVDEVRSWFGDDGAERRRLRDEEERMRQDRTGPYRDRSYSEDRDDTRYSASSRDRGRSDARGGWDSSRGYGSNIDRDYGRNDERSSRSNSERATAGYFRSSNEYGGSRNRDMYRDYPTHTSGRSRQNNEDDEMKHGYESRFDYHQANSSDHERMFGGRDYERNYPTRSERNSERQDRDLSGGWQSIDSDRGYRSLNNTGRTGIGQDDHLGRKRDRRPNPQDKNYSHGDYTPNRNAGGQEYDSRHYEQRGRTGSAINEHAQRGYSEGYGRTGYSLTQPSGNYANAEMSATKHPKNYKGADDRIYVEVCEALGREFDASDIEVTASGNEITLTGSVSSRDEKRRADRIAERVHGVEDVHNQLTVKAGSSTQSSSNETVQGNSSQRTEGSSNDGSNGSGRASSTNGSGKTARK